MNAKPRPAFNMVVSGGFLGWAVVFAALAVVETRWWLVAAVPMSFVGLLEIASEHDRTTGKEPS